MKTLGNVRARLAGTLDALRPPAVAHAHCDIPCGIYDPHEAQIGALTVLRMVQLIQEAKGAGTPEEQKVAQSRISRYTAVKEQHAERVKHEIRVIWGDYFTADMLKQFPQTSELVLKILKQASKARQEVDATAAQDLLSSVQEFAEIFWKTKNVVTKKLPSHQKSGGEIVYPAA